MEKSQRWLASEIGYDPAQVNKWISGKERIPDFALMRVGSCLSRNDFEIARSLLVINTIIEALPGVCKPVQSTPEVGFELAKALAVKADATASQLSLDQPERLEHLQRHLTTASEVLQMASQCTVDQASVIREDNIDKHLRFPSNVMMGELLTFARGRQASMGEVDQQIMKSIRKTVQRADGTSAQLHCKQHAYHLLGRYGTKWDHEFVGELIATRKDAVTRRTAHYSAIFAARSPLESEPFIFELRQDKMLEKINLDFDFVHYGDKELGVSHPTKGVGRTVTNNLRHIQSNRGTATTEIALHKLIAILDTLGLAQFESKSIRERIESVLRDIRDSEPQRRTPMEAEFLVRFGNLSLFRPQVNAQLILPGFIL
jgi:hypothetical protein